MPKQIFYNTLTLQGELFKKYQTLIAFGNNLRKLRNAKQMSLEALAFEADVELSQIYRIEKGKINPTLTTVLAIAKGLEIDPSELFKFK